MVLGSILGVLLFSIIASSADLRTKIILSAFTLTIILGLGLAETELIKLEAQT